MFFFQNYDTNAYMYLYRNIDMQKTQTLEQKLKEQYEKIGNRIWTCTECSRKINRDTMNPFLLSMCQKCQNGMCGI